MFVCAADLEIGQDQSQVGRQKNLDLGSFDDAMRACVNEPFIIF